MKKIFGLLVILVGVFGLYAFTRKPENEKPDFASSLVKAVVAIEIENFLTHEIVRQTDKWGSGAFGASRDGGTRTHKGLDLTYKPNSYYFAPFHCKLLRIGQVYESDTTYKLIEIQGTKLMKGWRAKIMYVESLLQPSDNVITKGTPLATVQDITEKYDGITPHIHFELYNPQGVLVDPTYYV